MADPDYRSADRKELFQCLRRVCGALDTTDYGRNPNWGRALRNWERREVEYAARGYHTVPLDEFIEVFWSEHQPQGLGIKRAAGGAPITYDQYFRQVYGDQQRIVPNEMITVVELPKGGQS